MKNLLRKIIYQRFYKPIISKKKNLPKKKFNIQSFGDLNKDKIFYVIKR